MPRIIAGSAKGCRLAVPAQGTRPTADRVREAVFSRLTSLGAIERARVLDLYAGSGALGLEALSRGALHADLVERAAAAAKVCRDNIAATGLPARLHRASVMTFLEETRSEWDLVFADPPYDLSGADLDAVLTRLASHVSGDAVVVVERARRDGCPAPQAWPGAWRGYKYGETTVWLSDLAASAA
ncbi:RsmD family RNA methyltransferase [Nanchangia anserum]|uniref:RsmD family RNA methyltransferase n=1 Tax=Nanchangia anserum TaxID=2692125 RepID=A0A8I0GAL4_9ACTO|nr:RsmD family RNA methyltransferase [Nanchangia anserum]MBD3690209.1 RsmD family RNA methyltransferase [Nanchangia anserum]QOX82343.1 RsmD family RNA methyltransferase [Nanchangia anserum]